MLLLWHHVRTSDMLGTCDEGEAGVWAPLVGSGYLAQRHGRVWVSLVLPDRASYNLPTFYFEKKVKQFL